MRQIDLTKRPRVHDTAFVAPGAVLLGNVEIGQEASIWYNCVLRGDVSLIRVGARSNIQDLSCCHGQYKKYDVIIGEDVTVGHCALVHGCVVEDRCLIGMGSRLLNGVVVEEESIVAAGAVLLEGTRVPRRSLVAGLPGKVKRTLDDAAVAFIQDYTDHYIDYSSQYKKLSKDELELLQAIGLPLP